MPRLIVGHDALAQLDRELERLGSQRAAIFCGSSLARSSAVLGRITSALGTRCAGVFSGVRAHSPLPAVQAGAEELKRLNADAVIAVGGGSAVVSARAAAILLAEGRDARSLATSQDANGQLISPKLLAAKLPQLVIPTTPNTATVKAGSALFDPASGDRLALFDPKTRARVVFIDPQCLASAPRALVISAALDTLVSALEGLVSSAANPISDAFLMHAVRLLAAHLASPGQDVDVEGRVELTLAAALCGHGTDSSGGGAATVLGHAVGSTYGVENGWVKAIVLPYVLRFNAGSGEAGLRNIASALGGRAAPEPSVEAISAALEDLFRGLSVPRRLRELDVPRAALAEIARRALGDWFLRTNPRPVRSASELQQLVEEAW